MKNGMIVKRAGKAGACFHLLADDGLVLGRSGEYAEDADFDRAVSTLRQICGAPVEDQTGGETESLPCPKYELFKNEAGKYSFLLREEQGTVLLQGQASLVDYTCRRGIQLIARFAPDAPVVVPNIDGADIVGQAMNV